MASILSRPQCDNGHKAPAGCRPSTIAGNLQGSQSIHPAKLVPNHPAPMKFIQLTNCKPRFAPNMCYGVLFRRIRWLYFFLDVHDSRLECFSMKSSSWWRYDSCLSGSSLVFWWRDAPLVRDFQMWSRHCQLWNSHWLHERKCDSVEYDQPYKKFFFWYIQSHYLYNNYLIKTPLPTAFHLQQFQGSCHHLWFTVGILWHWNERG